MKKPLKIDFFGGGPSGSMSALLLSKEGHKVTLYEKRTTIPRRLCGEYLCPRGVELLESYQLYEKLCGEFLPVEGMILSSPQEIIVKCSFPKTNREWTGVSLNRMLFDQNLLNEAQSNHVDIKYGTLVKKLMKTDSGWILATEKEESEFDLVIAGDGRVSSIAKMLSHAGKLDTSRVAVHFYLPRKQFLGSRFGEMHIFQDGSYCGIDPINDNEVNVSFVFNVEKVKSNNLHELCNRYLMDSKRLVEMFGKIPLDVEMKTITPLKNINNFIAGDALAYVGDASGFIDPLTGEGIYNALLSAHLLVSSIKEEIDLDRALKKYKKVKGQVQFQKKILNTFFQSVIKSPKMCFVIAKVIQSNSKRADSFIGIIGNIYTPIGGFVKMILAQ
jgi:flavin-dependent dehydrogenase